jgi:SAM-dependent methyltransferase
VDEFCILNNWFENWFNSPYYHLLYFDRNEAEARAFINRLMEVLSPQPNSRFLDIGCGKGRHSLALSEKGYEVTGIDLAPYMISEAKRLENDHLEFFLHDIRLPFRVNYYHYAVIFFTSFGYFKTRREHDDAIRTIANALLPGGVLLIDYLNVHYVESNLVFRDKKEVNGVEFYLTRWMDEEYFYKKIEIEEEALEEPLIFTERVTKFSLGDFTDMLAYQGMQVEEVYGNYQLGHYDLYKSPRMIIRAKKARR